MNNLEFISMISLGAGLVQGFNIFVLGLLFKLMTQHIQDKDAHK